MRLPTFLYRRSRLLPPSLHRWIVPAKRPERRQSPDSGPDSDRRAFVRSLLITLGVAQTGSMAAAYSRLLTSARGPSAPDPGASVAESPEAWSLAAFERLRGTCFLVAGQRLLLEQVEGRSNEVVDTVSLRFRGPALCPLKSQLHRFWHPAYPAADLFVVPGSAGNGRQLYRVTICRFAPQFRSPPDRPGELSRRLGAGGPETTPV